MTALSWNQSLGLSSSMPSCSLTSARSRMTLPSLYLWLSSVAYSYTQPSFTLQFLHDTSRTMWRPVSIWRTCTSLQEKDERVSFRLHALPLGSEAVRRNTSPSLFAPWLQRDSRVRSRAIAGGGEATPTNRTGRQKDWLIQPWISDSPVEVAVSVSWSHGGQASITAHVSPSSTTSLQRLNANEYSLLGSVEFPGKTSISRADSNDMARKYEII